MYNIWGVLEQGIAVSITAAVILIFIYLIGDHAPAGKRKYTWLILAARAFWPASASFSSVPYLSFEIDKMRAFVEKGLASRYSSPWVPAVNDHVFPVIKNMPQSSSDWIFAVYAAGVIAFAALYLIRAAKEPAERGIWKLLWKIVRCLNWYNPFVHFVCRHAEDEGGEGAGDKSQAMLYVCLAIMVASVLLAPRNMTLDDYALSSGDENAQAAARLARASSYVGAIDAYAKGVMAGSEVYLAIASPYEKHEELWASAEEGRLDYQPKGNVATNYGYYVYNITEQNGTYEAVLGLDLFEVFDEDGVNHDLGSAFIPIKAWQNDRYWLCEPLGEWKYSYGHTNFHSANTKSAEFEFGLLPRYECVPPFEVFETETDHGSVAVERRTLYQTYMRDAGFASYMDWNLYRAVNEIGAPELDAEFETAVELAWVDYNYSGPASDGETLDHQFGIQLVPLDDEKDKEYVHQKAFSSNYEGRSRDYSWFYWDIPDGWDGNAGLSWCLEDVREGRDIGTLLPPIEGYRVAIHWDGHIVEELTFRR